MCGWQGVSWESFTYSFYLVFIFSKFYAKVSDYQAVRQSNCRTINMHPVSYSHNIISLTFSEWNIPKQTWNNYILSINHAYSHLMILYMTFTVILIVIRHLILTTFEWWGPYLTYVFCIHCMIRVYTFICSRVIGALLYETLCILDAIKLKFPLCPRCSCDLLQIWQKGT